MEEELALNAQERADDSKFVSLVNVNKVYDKNVHAVYDFNLDI